MKRFLAILLVSTLLPAADDVPLFSEIGVMQNGLSAITGLPFTRRVPYALIDKEQLRRFLQRRIKQAIKPSDLRAEELTLKLLGLLPSEFDLRQSTLDLLTEQAAAFYDYDRKKLFLLQGGGTGPDQRIALVHELAHALADQHFHLGKYIHEGSINDDGATARLAVMEGQASWLMTAYTSKQSGGPAEVPDGMLALMTQGSQGSADQYPVFSNAPPYIRESLVFPYTAGLLFQNAVYHKLGQASFAEVFLNSPASTQQILHPDLYLTHLAPVIPNPPPVPERRVFRKLAAGTLGELDYRVLLSQYTSKGEGAEAATHLAGSSYALLEHKRDRTPLLAFASTWDSEDSARKYFDLYRRVLRGKWKILEIASDSATSLDGRGDSGRFRMWMEGATVNHLEGLH